MEQIATPESQNDGFVNSALNFLKEFLEHFALGAFAGGIGAAAVYPIDLGKTRLQNQVLVQGEQPQYKGVLDAMRQVFAAEGPVGMYRGLFPQLAGVSVYKLFSRKIKNHTQ